MAHLKKFTKSAIGHMLEHYDRTELEGKEHIRKDRTHLNYNLANIDDIQIDRMNEILSRKNVKCQNREDVNVACSWIITMPKTLDKSLEAKFFKYSFEFLKNQYDCNNNIISSYVHKDEKHPHMHFVFVPLIKDKKHPDRFKVSAKELLSKYQLKYFHIQLQEYLEKKLGCEVDILNEATKAGNQSIAELKRAEAEGKMAELKAYQNAKKQTKKTISEIVNIAKKSKKKKNIFGNENVEISHSDFDKLVEIATSVLDEKYKNEELLAKLEIAERNEEILRTENKRLNSKIKTAYRDAINSYNTKQVLKDKQKSLVAKIEKDRSKQIIER